MSRNLRNDIKMSQKVEDRVQRHQPLASLEQEVYLNLQRTADALARGLERTLRPASLSATQYNVLRILRGAGERGLTCSEIARRMLTHDPDGTRLPDRLQRRGLIRRQRQPRDRRVIRTRLTPEGLEILATLDDPVAALLARLLAHLGPERLRTLNDLLAAARESTDGG